MLSLGLRGARPEARAVAPPRAAAAAAAAAAADAADAAVAICALLHRDAARAPYARARRLLLGVPGIETPLLLLLEWGQNTRQLPARHAAVICSAGAAKAAD